jgi:hypothetical protein
MRKVLFAIAGVVSIHSLWLLVPEHIRPGIEYFPQSLAAAQAGASEKGRANSAAWIALIRGDLWTEAAVRSTAPFAFEVAMADQASAGRVLDGSERSRVERAGSWSPHDARAWLLLAAISLSPGGSDVRMIEALKLSYFTGPNELELIPLRLALVTRSQAVHDPDIERFARQDIQTIVIRLPNLRPAVIQAYKGASPDGRRFLAEALAPFDPNLLRTLDASSSGK